MRAEALKATHLFLVPQKREGEKTQVGFNYTMLHLNERSLQLARRAPRCTAGHASSTAPSGRGCRSHLTDPRSRLWDHPVRATPRPASRPGSSPQATRGRLPAGAAPPPAGQYGGGGGVRGAVSRCPLRASLLGAAATADPPPRLPPGGSALPSAAAMGPAGPAGRVWVRCPCGCPGEAGSEREDAAVAGAAHILHALLPARRRHDGHGAHLRAGLGRLAPALRRPPRPLLPGGGRPPLHHLPEHGALLLRELRGRAGEPVARRGAPSRRPVGSGGRQRWARPVPRAPPGFPRPRSCPRRGEEAGRCCLQVRASALPCPHSALRAEALGAPRRVILMSCPTPSDAFQSPGDTFVLQVGSWRNVTSVMRCQCSGGSLLARVNHAACFSLRTHGATLVVDKNIADYNCTSYIYVTLLHLPTSVVVYLLSGLGLQFWISHWLWLFSTSERGAWRLRLRRQSWQSVLPYQRVWVQVIMLCFTTFSSHVKCLQELYICLWFVKQIRRLLIQYSRNS